MNEKFYISFSATESFKTCQRKYYYNYIAKLPKKEWPWLTFGNFNHLVLEKFHNYIIYFKRKNKPYDKKHLMSRAFHSSIRKSYRLYNSGKQSILTEKQIAETKKLLKKYLAKVNDNEPDALFTEKYFEIDLGDGYWLRGYIDRIDKVNSKQFKIVDYKTSREAFAYDKNDQLAIYAIGLRKILDAEDVEIFKQLDFIKLGRTNPLNPEGVVHDHSGDSDILSRIKDLGISIRNKIVSDKKESDWTPTDNDFCWCCDFKDACYKQRGISDTDHNFG